MLEKERAAILKYWKKNDWKLEIWLQTHTKKFTYNKSASLSTKSRKKGNLFYAQDSHSKDEHIEIFKLYCKSILYAPFESEELILAFGNRSALLFHLKKYKESILDIDKALTLSKSSSFKIKLLCRKAECLIKLEEPFDVLNDVLKSAEELFNTIQDDKCKNILRSKINDISEQAKSLSDDNELENNLNTANVNEVENCFTVAFDSIELRFSEKYGNHLVATRDFEPGDIIFVEQ